MTSWRQYSSFCGEKAHIQDVLHQFANLDDVPTKGPDRAHLLYSTMHAILQKLDLTWPVFFGQMDFSERYSAMDAAGLFPASHTNKTRTKLNQLYEIASAKAFEPME